MSMYMTEDDEKMTNSSDDAAGGKRVNRYAIARYLDSLAIKAKEAGDTPASRRQCWYLAGLIFEAGDDHNQLTDPLTKSLASELISQYIGEDEA